MKTQAESASFAEQLGATPLGFEQNRSIFAADNLVLSIKISRSVKPFWGISENAVNKLCHTNSPCAFYSIFLVNENEGWVYSSNDVQRMIASGRWKVTKGQYKINSPLEDKLMFSNIDRCKKLLARHIQA